MEIPTEKLLITKSRDEFIRNFGHESKNLIIKIKYALMT